MSLTTVGSRQLTKNPLDLVEELVSVNDWAYERAAVDELAVPAAAAMPLYVRDKVAQTTAEREAAKCASTVDPTHG